MQTQVWYAKSPLNPDPHMQKMLRDLRVGWNFFHTNHPEHPINPRTINQTHTLLTMIDTDEMGDRFAGIDTIWNWMQGENWSDGDRQKEAQALIRSLDLTHTSMSVGDILIQNDTIYFCDGMGWKKIIPYLVRRSRYFDQRTLYSAWMPSKITGPHSTITFFDHLCYGQVGSDPDKKLYEHLQGGSPERVQAVEQAYNDRYCFAYSLIIEAFLEALHGTRDHGEIILNDSLVNEPFEKKVWR